VFCSVRAELARAERHSKEVRRFAEGRNDAAWKCFGLVLSGDVSHWLGKFIDARAYLEDALSCWHPSHRAVAPTPEDPYVHILKMLYRTLVCTGQVDQARARRDEALAEARRISPYSRASMLRQVRYGDWAIGGAKTAATLLRLAEEVFAISSERGFALPLAFGNLARGWCLGVMGQPADGISVIQKGMGSLPRGANLGTPFHLVALAELYGKAERPEEGLKRLAEAAVLVEQTAERWIAAEVHRQRGELLLLTNGHDAAEESFKQALALAQHKDAKYWELRAVISLARLWSDQGKQHQALDLLAPTCRWFEDASGIPDLDAAKGLLATLTA
jgi:tetratricopeptide (TPR) repeat protein